MQGLISRFGGTPALILKLLFLGVINAARHLGDPRAPELRHLGDADRPRGAARLALDFFMFTQEVHPGQVRHHRRDPAHGLPAHPDRLHGLDRLHELLDGPHRHQGRGDRHDPGATRCPRPRARSAVRRCCRCTPRPRRSSSRSPRSRSRPTEEILTEEPTDAASPEASVQTEFGGTESSAEPVPSPEASVQTEFGGSEASPEAVASPEASVQTEFGVGRGRLRRAVGRRRPRGGGDMNLAVTEPEGGWPPTYIGTNDGLDEVPPGDVQRDEFGTVTGVTGYATVPEADYPDLDATARRVSRCRARTAASSSPQGFTNATELTPTSSTTRRPTPSPTPADRRRLHRQRRGVLHQPGQPGGRAPPRLEGDRRLEELHGDPHRPGRPRAVLPGLRLDLRLRLPDRPAHLRRRTGPRHRAQPAGHARPADLPLAADRPVRGAGLPVRCSCGPGC